MKFKDGKTFSAYVRSKLHSGYITLHLLRIITLYTVTATRAISLAPNRPAVHDL